MEENTSFHSCPCGKKFKQRSGLFKHSKKCDKAATSFTPLARKPCKEENCNYSYRYIEELRNHLETAHKFTVVCETVMFKNYEEFLAWKEEYEIKTVSSFTRNNVKKMHRRGGRATEYYYCHRSGQYKCMSKGKRRLKSQGSLKINTTCTAALKVTTFPDESVKVFVCHTHYGHKMDLCHVKISKRDKELLASQLRNGIPKEKILHTLSPSNAVTLERKNLIMRKDLNNISKAFGLKRGEKTKQYRLNVDDFFQEVINDGTASVLLYKRRKEELIVVPENIVCPFQPQDFVFAFMNQFQKEIFLAYGNGILCFDSTSDCYADFPLQNEVSHYDSLKIFSLAVIDEYGDGIPVAWLISNREDKFTMRLFFQQIKDLLGVVTPKAVMTDRTSDSFECWVDVFEGEPMKLICSWHVHTEWREKISLIGDQEAAGLCYQVLCLLLQEEDMAKFIILMQRCIKEMNDNEALVEFGKYFCDQWTVIQEQWAACFRSGLGFDTYSHIDSIHQEFKNYFFQERFRKSPNKCLSLVLNFSSDLNMKRHEKHEAEKSKILESHRQVSNMSWDAVKQISPNTWYVTTDENVCGTTGSLSGSTYSLVYVVEEMSGSCTDVCNVKCAYCQTCMHLYKCSCSNSKPTTEICEHSHLVAVVRMRECAPELSSENIILDEEPNAVELRMLDHNYFEVAPKENQRENVPVVSKEKTQAKCDVPSFPVVPNLNVSVSSLQPQKCFGVYGLANPDPPVNIPLQTDRRLGVPILPKPASGQVTKLLGIIIVPDSVPTVETLRETLLQQISVICERIRTCTDRNALLALQSHLNSCTNALENPNPTASSPRIVSVTGSHSDASIPTVEQ